MATLALFDLDKTLIESSKVKDEIAFPEALNQVYDVETSLDRINPHGMTDPKIIIELAKKAGVEEKVAESKLKECIERMEEIYKKNSSDDKVKLIDGVETALDYLKSQDIIMALVTGNIESIAWSKVKHAGIESYFDFGGFGSDSSERYKMIDLAVEKFRERYKAAPDNIFLVGDSPKDIQAGLKAGVITVGMTGGIYSEYELREAGADYIIDNWNDKAQLNQVFGI